MSTRVFNKKVYVLPAIQDAITAYDDFATMDVETDDEAWTVSFSEVHEDVEGETLANEFANFVLAGTIQRSR